MKFEQIIAKRTGLAEKYVRNAIELLRDGATIPFISRYRKEATGGMSDVDVTNVSNELDNINELVKRRQYIQTTIESQGKLTEELRLLINNCWDATTLEDIYLPYKQKRRTKALVAREAGLEPLANMIQAQNNSDIRRIATRFVNPEKGIENVEEALSGAKDIIAERISENERARNTLRTTFTLHASITSKVVKGKDAEGQNFRDYFDWSERLDRCSSHRLLAMRRGESEGILRINIGVDDKPATERLARQFVKGIGECSMLIREAVEDSYKRLLEPSISNEFATSSKQKADKEAIRIFAMNLEQLLMASPLGQKRVMGIDPGFRTGCKVVCLDEQGTLLHHDVIYPHPPRNERVKAMQTIQEIIKHFKIQAISVGNGTAGRETEEFLHHLGITEDINIYTVSEDGASIYSTSQTAREEFPDEDVTVRGAVSIGRRLMDPLAELVKIDPSSIGVGQYQKDVNQTALKKSLDQTVINCVNRVGVNVNTASSYLLTYVSGLGNTLAQNIVEYRRAHGPFRSRKELLNVPRMGSKSFEQCAGFLRVPESIEPLDNSAVHPECYPLVERMARDCNCNVQTLLKSADARKKIDINRYVTQEIGFLTLKDIIEELEKPGRDPRGTLTQFAFDPTVHEITDIHAGQILPGIVTNITNFGAFVDIGVHVKGLIHISQMADKYVKDPTTILKLHQQLMVRVLEVDVPRQRISLSLKQAERKPN